MLHDAGHSLELRSINHRFGSFVAANDINLDIRAGELISLLGPSGCGKTTLLKIIAGFIRQSSGDVLVDGTSISHLSPKRRQIGIVFQNYALFPHMTVAENVAYGPAAAGETRAAIDLIVEEMLNVVQMGAFRTRLPRELSGGQQQRIALARCLAIRPQILLLDEPFSALDKNLRLDMQIEIKQLQRKAGITTVLVTHDQEEALSMSDRVAVLSRGNLEQFASPVEIYDRPATLFVNGFIGTANLIKGIVTGKSPSGTCVKTHGGETFDVPFVAELQTGDAALLSVRPEAIRLAFAEQPAALPARISAVMPIGPSLIYEVRLADGTLVKVVQERAGDDLPTLDTAVFLTLKTDRISGVFPDPSASKGQH